MAIVSNLIISSANYTLGFEELLPIFLSFVYKVYSHDYYSHTSIFSTSEL